MDTVESPRAGKKLLTVSESCGYLASELKYISTGEALACAIGCAPPTAVATIAKASISDAQPTPLVNGRPNLHLDFAGPEQVTNVAPLEARPAPASYSQYPFAAPRPAFPCL